MDQILIASFLTDIFDSFTSSGLDLDMLIEYCNFLGIPCKKENLDQNIINKLESFYITHGMLPENIDTFSYYILSSCLCGFIVPQDLFDAAKVLSNILKNGNLLPSCRVVSVFLEFYKQERRHPDPEEILTYINNLERISRDPEGYYQDTKLQLPTPNLSLLQEKPCSKSDNCGLCMEEISEGNDCFILPCNHIFHSKEDECIGSTVKKWLSENKVCPICKKEVILEKGNEEEEVDKDEEEVEDDEEEVDKEGEEEEVDKDEEEVEDDEEEVDKEVEEEVGGK